MFANVTIYSPAIIGGWCAEAGFDLRGQSGPGLVAHEDKSIELRHDQAGLTNGDLVESRVI